MTLEQIKRSICSVPSAALVAIAVFACGPGSGAPAVMPTLPGDGNANTAKPTELAKDPGKPGAKDPWAGRPGLIEAPIPTAPRPVELPPISRFTLKNGLDVIVIENHDLPVVSLQLAIKVGRADSSKSTMGISRFVANMLTLGTRTRSAAKLAQQIEAVGGSLSGQASYENTLLSCSVMSKDLKTCTKTVADIVVNPSFPAKQIEVVREELVARARRRMTDPAQVAAAHFQNLLWGDEHVRGWPITETTLSSIKRKQLVAWHRAWFRPNNAVMAIAGDVDANKLKAVLDKSFRFWRKGAVPKRNKYKAPKLDGIKARLVDNPQLAQAHIRVGHIGLAHGDKSFYASLVFNHVLGGAGGASRLMRRVKADSNNTAGASSGFDSNREPGVFVASAVAQTKDAISTVRVMLQEMGELAKSGPTKTEVAAAHASIGGRYSTGFETASAIANAVLAAQLHGFRDDYVRNFGVKVAGVTPDQARAAAAKVLDPTNVALVIVGDAKAIEPQLRAVGVSFERVDFFQPVARWERDPEPNDPKAAEAAGRKVLDKALAAKGGRDKLQAIKSLILIGKARGQIKDPKKGTQRFRADVKRSFIAPGRMRRDMVIHGNGTVESGIVLDGKTAWAYEKRGKDAGSGELPPAFVEALRAQLWRDQEFILLRHLDKSTKVAAFKDKVIDGVPHYVVRVSRADGVSSTLYIDKKTDLLTRMSYTAQGSKAVETYGDYKKVGGIMVAHRRLTVEATTTFDVVIEKISFNVPVDAKIFAKPKK